MYTSCVKCESFAMVIKTSDVYNNISISILSIKKKKHSIFATPTQQARIQKLIDDEISLFD